MVKGGEMIPIDRKINPEFKKNEYIMVYVQVQKSAL